MKRKVWLINIGGYRRMLAYFYEPSTDSASRSTHQNDCANEL